MAQALGSPSSGFFFSLPAPLSAGIAPCIRLSGKLWVVGNMGPRMGPTSVPPALILLPPFPFFSLAGATVHSISSCSSSFSLPRMYSLSSRPLASQVGGSGP